MIFERNIDSTMSCCIFTSLYFFHNWKEIKRNYQKPDYYLNKYFSAKINEKSFN